MPLRAVLFDLGNTLVEYGPVGWEVWIRGLEEVYRYLYGQGLRPLPDRASFVGLAQETLRSYEEIPDHHVIPLAERLRAIADKLGMAASEASLQESLKLLLGPMMEAGRLDPEAIEVLAALRARELRLGLVSNLPWGAPAHLWRAEVERLGLAPCFEAMVFCEDVGYRKPHPAIFQACLRLLAVSAAEALFVGDSPGADIAGAKSLGMRTVRRRNEWALDWEGPAADWEIERLGELLQLVDDLQGGESGEDARFSG